MKERFKFFIQTHKAALMFLALAIVTGTIFLGTPNLSQAQITKTARIVLEDGKRPVYIGPQIYATQDPKKRLTYQIIISRHENNLRGIRFDNKLVNLGTAAPPVWMVFSVTNNSSTEDWVLHFGKVLDGRQALAHKLLVRNHTIGETFTRSLREKDKEGAYGQDMQGPALPIKIRKGQTDLFVLYMEAEGGFPNTIKPFLMTSKSYINMLRYGDIPSGITNIFFICMMGFFVAVSFMQKNPRYLLFSGYYLINALLFFTVNNSFFAAFTLMGEAMVMLYVGSLLMGLFITKFFLDITVENHTESLLLFGAGAFLAFISLFNLLLFGENTIMDDILIFIPTSLTIIAIIGFSFIQAQKGKFAGHYYAAAWFCVFLGSLITALSAAGFFSTNTLLMNAYWISLLPQAAFFITGTNQKMRLTEQEQKHLRSRENREAHSLARLQQSKESADQARLLRVIERERELMAELREREMQRTEEMRHAKDMADKANRAKSAFLAVVSHEIRTPMTGIMGMVRLLIDTKLSKEQTDFAITIQQSGDTMMALLNDILDFEKIESGNMELEDINFDLPRLIQDVVTLMSGHADGKHIELKSDIAENFPRILIGDPTRLRQIILNLTSNAIKFTQKGGVTIRLRANQIDKQESGINKDYEIYVAVEDTGIGIAEEVQENLFNPFSQADKTVLRKYGGTGLGLAIVKRLVEAMGGAINVKSEQNVGSTFFFSILMNENTLTQTDIEEHAMIEKIDIPSMHILVIEDNEMNRKVIKGFLDRAGHTSTLCESGEDALEVIQTGDFDVVFTDISLNGMDGFETTRTIRTLPNRAIASLPIIAISGNVGSEDVENYYKAGMNGFIPKPIDPDKITEILRKIHTNTLENPVVIQPHTRPSDEDKPAQGPFNFQNQDEITPAQRFLQQQEAETAAPLPESPPALEEYEDDNFDSFAEAEEIFNEAENQDDSRDDILDNDMLQTLIVSIGREPLIELIQGFIDTTDQIIATIPALETDGNAEEIMGRAHELRGMAANFGMKELSKIAGVAEKSAKDGHADEALVEMKKLPDANQRAKHAIQEWLDNQT